LNLLKLYVAEQALYVYTILSYSRVNLQIILFCTGELVTRKVVPQIWKRQFATEFLFDVYLNEQVVHF